ncbi:MAG: glycine--tRNA ligase subunit beta [Betaproteobacteria bacterium]|nr:glycine--tRNA ligase subunit beta [Betaproteobacteria bacterium]
MKATLLVEILSEELPPKSLRDFDVNFCSWLFEELAKLKLVARTVVPRHYATPRRLAAVIPEVLDRVAGEEKEIAGPSVKVGLDANGKPTQAIIGFAKKAGIAVEALERRGTPKGEVFVARVVTGEITLDTVLAELVEKALKRLPIPKLMRWGDGDAQFVRPVHRLVMLHGERVVPGIVLGLDSGNRTRGHRFMGRDEIVLRSAGDYEAWLGAKDCMVLAGFDAREARIREQLNAKAAELGASLGSAEDIAVLLGEVAALVEHPSVYAGTFDADFLGVPQECLILTMRKNQKYFPLFGADGRLLPRFLIVSNMALDDPRHVIDGNQRVVRPRLEDARFFFDQDRKTRLEARVPKLAAVVYHAKLGSQLERVERVQLLAGSLARLLGADALLAERAAWLAKADLITGMVGEFPELQGTMGRHYALHDGENAEVADAIEQHYRPRFAGDALPEGPVAIAVAIADKLDTLAGLFGIGQQPTGDRDPYGLRRAALGVIRILVERRLPLTLGKILGAAFAGFNARIGDASADLETFVFERFSGYLREQKYSTLEVDAVLGMRPARLDLVPLQLEAVRAFLALPEAASLAAANKRIRNILNKSAPPAGTAFLPGMLVEAAESSLYDAFGRVEAQAAAHLEAGRYVEALSSLAALKAPVDAFFDSVMVNAEDAELRTNRLLLLQQLDRAMNRVADISRLAT